MNDVNPIAISALQHYTYCPCQCALIHIEQVFDDNVYTARGQAVHRLVDTSGYEIKAGVKIETPGCRCAIYTARQQCLHR